ncbi:MAG: vWA domain-containing protein [Acidimicrobiia bacterium]
MSDPFASYLIQFARYLRTRGLTVVPQTSADLLQAAALVGLADRDDLYLAMRSVSLSRPEERPAFDEAFELFFGGRAPTEPEPPGGEVLEVKKLGSSRPVAVQGGWEEQERESSARAGWSAVERLVQRDFAELSPEELAEVRRLISRMGWEPALTRSRRLNPARRPRSPDLRRTLRRAVKQEGPLIPLAFAERRRRPRPLVVLADVSGSMERYTEVLLHFIHATRGRLGRVEAFVFATRLTRVTREIRERNANLALAKLASSVHDWSGGTRIGEALRTFNRQWSRRAARGGPIALVISDGWDRGDPHLLREEMARFARSVHRVVWLNPLAGHEDYQPEARGIRTALPYVDDFLPAANLADLTEVVGLLESMS